jgi:hypothetical protein
LSRFVRNGKTEAEPSSQLHAYPYSTPR